MKRLVLFFFLFVFGQVNGQIQQDAYSIHATLVDSLNKQVIPFASVYKSRDHKGTITDFKGEFILENVTLGDTIVCSYIGYEKTIFVSNGQQEIGEIYLHKEAQLMDEVVILADDAILYKLLSNTRKTNASSTKVAKTYFELESFQNNIQLELFQGYYNGIYQGYDVSQLDMKNARFALAPISKRIFASTETSRAMYLQKLMNSNDYFPTSPFELKANKLRKYYRLTLSSRYKDEKNKTVYVIQFEPKEKADESFQGTVWIDSLTNTILKVKLKVSDAKMYPFESLWPDHTLEKVNMEITKNFTEISGEMFLKSMDFDYDVIYRSSSDSILHINTRAVLYAYKYNDAFLLPYFNFASTSNVDYRRIQMLPYNQKFWDCTDEFKMGNKSENRNVFLNELATIKTYDLFSTNTIFRKNFFENPYVVWNGNRILFREESEDVDRYNLAQGTIPSQRYHLEVQLFMDINELCDSLQIVTKTIFDPYSSYYKFPMTKEGQAFINIYFDLMEIERRKLEIELSKCGNDLTQINSKYQASRYSAQNMSALFFKEVERGTNKANLQKWNNVVFAAIGIDNILLFELDE